MTVTVAWTTDAASDLSGVLEYIADKSPAGAASVAAAITTTVTSISEFPHAGRVDADTGCRERLVGRYPLLLIYTVSTDLVEIIALFHTSRDPATKPGAKS